MVWLKCRGIRISYLGEDICALPVARHMLYFIQTDTDIIIIRILSQHQDAGRHLNWQ
ncbi:predicted protein [Escherichia coli B088]|nr:predicted protein [Escherichia coli B088]